MSAWFWLIAWGLWGAIAILGAQGTTPIVALIGILGSLKLFSTRPTLNLPFILLVCFLVWCTITSFWSEGADEGLITFDIETWNLAVEAPGLRIGLTAILAAFAIWVVQQYESAHYQQVRYAAMFGLFTNAGLLLAYVSATDLVLYWGGKSSGPADIDQNAIKFVNASIMAMPVLAALSFSKNIGRLWIAMIVGFAILLMAAQISGSLAASVSIIVIIALSVAITFLGPIMFRWLGIATSVLILSMPWALNIMLQFVTPDYDTMSRSVYVRLTGFSLTLERLSEKFMFGWGVEATRAWRETELVKDDAGNPLNLPVLASHPHNMPLHVWVETGMVGAVLLALFSAAFGEYLYKNLSRNVAILIPSVALWGAVIVHGMLSFSLWNDAFWMGIVFLSTGMIIVSRRLNSDVGS